MFRKIMTKKRALVLGVVAALAAEGETVISDGSHVARGYEDLPGKLRSLGADVVSS